MTVKMPSARRAAKATAMRVPLAMSEPFLTSGPSGRCSIQVPFALVAGLLAVLAEEGVVLGGSLLALADGALDEGVEVVEAVAEGAADGEQDVVELQRVQHPGDLRRELGAHGGLLGQHVGLQRRGGGGPAADVVQAVGVDAVGLGEQEHHRLVEAEQRGAAEHELAGEAGGGAGEERVHEVGDEAAAGVQRLDDVLARLAEHEQLDLAGRVDEDLVGAEAVNFLFDFVEVEGDHVGGGDLGAVGAEAVLLHDLRDLDPLADVDVGRVRQFLGAGVEVDEHGGDAVLLGPAVVGRDERGLAGARGADEVDGRLVACAHYATLRMPMGRAAARRESMCSTRCWMRAAEPMSWRTCRPSPWTCRSPASHTALAASTVAPAPSTASVRLASVTRGPLICCSMAPMKRRPPARLMLKSSTWTWSPRSGVPSR